MSKHHKEVNGMRNANAWHTYQEMQNLDLFYFKAQACMREGNQDKASEKFMTFLKERGKTKTASGIPYSKTNVKLAMKRIKENSQTNGRFKG